MSSILLCGTCKKEYAHKANQKKQCPDCSSTSWSLVSREDVVDDSKSSRSQINNVPISNRSAMQNLELVESLVSNLAGTKKYKRAISDGEFSFFSIIGTRDWQDYASLSIDALQLLTLAQINENLEAIRKQLEGNATN
jgi:hypothetical protein